MKYLTEQEILELPVGALVRQTRMGELCLMNSPGDTWMVVIPPVVDDSNSFCHFSDYFIGIAGPNAAERGFCNAAQMVDAGMIRIA